MSHLSSIKLRALARKQPIDGLAEREGRGFIKSNSVEGTGGASRISERFSARELFMEFFQPGSPTSVRSTWLVKMLALLGQGFCEPVLFIKNHCVFWKAYLQTTTFSRNPHAQSTVNK